jgi:hypothetical protein
MLPQITLLRKHANLLIASDFELRPLTVGVYATTHTGCKILSRVGPRCGFWNAPKHGSDYADYRESLRSIS